MTCRTALRGMTVLTWTPILMAIGCSSNESPSETDAQPQGGAADVSRSTGGDSSHSSSASVSRSGAAQTSGVVTLGGAAAGLGGSASLGGRNGSASSGMGGLATMSGGAATASSQGGRRFGGITWWSGFGGVTPTGGSTSSGGSPSLGGSTTTVVPAASAGTASTSDPVPAPTLPSITGECPSFVTGTVSVAGLSGISLQVGTKQSGTGALLFYWHGTGSTANEVNRLVPASVRQEILDQGGIIVSFQSSLGTGGDCSGTSTFSKDDFEVADLIAACAVRDHAIDPRRIYTTGCSAGGLQAGCMAALRSSYIAAAAPNSGGEVTRQSIQDPAHIPAVMTMHGGTSDRVIVSFSSTSATFDEHMDSAGGFVVNCDHGGGHCAAPSELYSAAWDFMKAHPFGVEPEPFAAGLPESFPSYCAIY